jgi:hypothetical protein
MADNVKEQMTSAVERIRQTCIGQRKKSLAVHHHNSHGGGNATEETTTEGAVASQGQATPIGPDMTNQHGDSSSSFSSSSSSSTLSSSSTGTNNQNVKIGVRGCHDLRLAGETDTRTYSLASGKELNEGGRDYNTRFCDMTTDGGGWTVRSSPMS